jgi:Fic family protein
MAILEPPAYALTRVRAFGYDVPMTALEVQLQTIDNLKRRWDKLLPLEPRLLETLRLDWEITHTYNSNAIEGNTLTLGETKAILLDGITIGGKPLREHLEAVNHRSAMRLMQQLSVQQTPILETEILGLHRHILTGIQDGDAGRYRNTRVRVVGSSRIFPNPLKVPELMQQFVSSVDSHQHPVLQASRVHFGLVHIHPFADGNGRTARLLMNLLLLRHGYPPALVPLEVRARYYDALETANTGDLDPFDGLIAELVRNSLEQLLEALT